MHGVKKFLMWAGAAAIAIAAVSGQPHLSSTKTLTPALDSTQSTQQPLTPSSPDTYVSPPDTLNVEPTKPDNSSSTSGHYTNVDGNQVQSPTDSTSGEAPAGATAQCIDGSYSFSQHHRGTCSHHHGVARWL